MNDLFGLPAHPLVVHGAVVLVPLAAIGAVVIAVWPEARRRFGYVVVALAFLGLVFTFLAKESGEQLQERVKETAQVQTHAELGDSMTLFAFALFATSAGLVAVDVIGRRQADEHLEHPSAAPASWIKPATTTLAVLTVVAAVAGTVQVGRVGHSGAKATWENTPAAASTGGDRD